MNNIIKNKVNFDFTLKKKSILRLSYWYCEICLRCTECTKQNYNQNEADTFFKNTDIFIFLENGS